MRLILSIFLLATCWSGSAQSISDSYVVGERKTLHSDILQEDREVYIYVPQGRWGMDENAQMVPVIYVLDGESQFLSTVTTVDYLSAAGMGNDWMPRSIVVGIPNTNRNRDLTPSPGLIGADSTSLQITGGGPQFLTFVTEELGPFMDSLYHTSTHRTLIGHSLGGLTVLQALMTKTDYFDHYLAIDPFLRYNDESFLRDVVKELQEQDYSGKRLFVATANSLPPNVKLEDLAADTSDVAQLTKSNLKFKALGEAQNWNIQYQNNFYPKETHFSLPLVATPDALRYFYEYYSFREMMNYYHPSYAGKTDLVVRLEEHYQKISTHLGYELKPMQSYLNSWAFGFAQFNRKDLALDLFDLNIRLYSDVPAVYNAKAYYLLGEGQQEAAAKLFEQSLVIEEQANIRSVLEGLRAEKKN